MLNSDAEHATQPDQFVEHVKNQWLQTLHVDVVIQQLLDWLPCCLLAKASHFLTIAIKCTQTVRKCSIRYRLTVRPLNCWTEPLHFVHSCLKQADCPFICISPLSLKDRACTLSNVVEAEQAGRMTGTLPTDSRCPVWWPVVGARRWPETRDERRKSKDHRTLCNSIPFVSSSARNAWPVTLYIQM